MHAGPRGGARGAGAIPQCMHACMHVHRNFVEKKYKVEETRCMIEEGKKGVTLLKRKEFFEIFSIDTRNRKGKEKPEKGRSVEEVLISLYFCIPLSHRIDRLPKHIQQGRE
mmetsp:Transcript_38696/g.76070  ORF Transcript_38696/g.76070 Transcript_38696/m.76070 type:complete len:111 (-) Transcript_38696:124-456(-)